MKLVKFFGFIGLLFVPLTLLGLTAYDWLYRSVFVFIAIILMGLLLIYFALRMYQQNVNSEPWELKKIDWQDFLFAYFAAILTYNLGMSGHISSVEASVIMGLIGATIFKKHDKAIFAGSFLGMASATVFGAWGFVLASLLVAFVFVFTRPLFKGVGGKLGIVAFTGALLSFLLLDLTPSVGITFTLIQGVYLVIASVVGAVLTRVIAKIEGTSVVLASSLVGLIFMTFFDNDSFSLSPYIAICGYGASFVGMSDLKQMKNSYIVGFGGLLFGIIFYLGSNVFGGFGGKLGTTAFIASIITIGIVNRFNQIKSHEKTSIIELNGAK